MRPGQQIGERETPARKFHRCVRHRELAPKRLFLRVSGDRLICGDEADGQKRIVGKVSVHKNHQLEDCGSCFCQFGSDAPRATFSN